MDHVSLRPCGKPTPGFETYTYISLSATVEGFTRWVRNGEPIMILGEDSANVGEMPHVSTQLRVPQRRWQRPRREEQRRDTSLLIDTKIKDNK